MEEIQEELVKINLKIRCLNEDFASVSSESEMEAINAAVRSHLSRFRHSVDELALLGQQKQPDVKAMIAMDVENHRQQLAASQKQFKAANLRCILELQKREKEDLLSTREDDSGVRMRLQNRDELVKESSRATDNLGSIARQLATTVSRSANTVDELASSSVVVSETQEEFKGMEAMIHQSKKLITKYGRRESTDRFLIFFAFAFFFACVFYILRKRVLGPLDPFLLVWNTVSTLVTTVMSLLGF